MAPQIGQWNVSRWNDGSVWGPAQPQPKTHKMKAVLNLNNANAEEILRVGKNTLQGYADNPTVFTSPDPSLATFGGHTADLDAKIGAVTTAEEARKTAIIARDAAAALVLADLNKALPYVQKISGGDPSIIALANLNTKSPSLPVGKLPQVQNLSLTTSDSPGAADAHWDAVTGRKNYEHAHCTGDPLVEANWKLVGSSSASKATFANQPSGTRLWARVRAKGTKPENDGAWSQPANIIIP